MLIEIYEMVYKIRNTLLSLKESIANTGNPPATATNKQVRGRGDTSAPSDMNSLKEHEDIKLRTPPGYN